MKKRLISVLLAAATVSGTFSAFPYASAGSSDVYEFESGTISSSEESGTAVTTLSGASGGKAVDLKDSGDSVTLEFYAENEGTQSVSIRYCQPYDKDGKYQNVSVNGKSIGEIFCAYTGNGKFRTATIEAALKKGSNTITVESSWGWTYLDCLTVGAVSSSSSFAANPVISRGVPAYSGKSDSAGSANDDKYYTSWTSYAEDYIAYDLSSVPESQRKQVLAVWYNNGTYDNIGIYVNKSDEPVDYTIEVNNAGGGSYPDSGWKTVEEITGNGFSSRQHLVDMEGYNWIRMKVTRADGGKVSFNFDIHDASNGVSDSWVFFGDSITAGGMGNAYGTGYASYVNQLDGSFFPAQQNGGIGGITSRDGKENIDKWLNGSPVKYVSIAYGTNDCWGNPGNTEAYYSNTKYMIDAILKAGKVPVLPKIPYSTNSDVGSNVGYYNAMIDKLYNEYGDSLVHGPDFEEYFRNNTWGLGPDGVHPNSEGYDGMRKLWAETMYNNVYSSITTTDEDLIDPADNNPGEDISGQTDNTPADVQYTSSEGFHVENQKIIDANGNEFIMRGVNVAHAWYQNNTEQTLRAVAAKGCNTVRVVCEDGGSGRSTSADDLRKIIGWCKENKLICIVEVHDATGKNDISDITAAAKYWTGVKDVLNENTGYVIVNIANEWVGKWDTDTWAQGYQQAIKIMRDAGIRNMLMVDAAGWGQYGNSIKEKGAEVFSSDPDRNVVFSIHFYGTAGKDAQTIKSNIDGALSAGAPVLAGEFGYYHSDGDVDEIYLMNYCDEKGLGYIAWSWKGNGGGVEYLDLVSDWDGNSLTEWGEIYFGAMKNSKISSVYTDGINQKPVKEDNDKITEEPVNEDSDKTVQEPAAEEEFTFGDINGDEKIDITDLSILAVHLIDKTEFTNRQTLAADVAYDGTVDLADLATLRQYISKVIVKLGK